MEVVPIIPTANEQARHTEVALSTAGQRRINILWEVTQALIAVSVTGAFIWVSIIDKMAPDLKNAFFLIIGFYFSRTNHAAIGGIGIKPVQTYEGR